MSPGYRYAEIIQKEYENGNQMAYFAFLKGIGAAKLELKEGTGHNIYAVIEGIHELQDANPKRTVKQGYEAGLTKVAQLVFSPQEAESIVQMIAGELKYERDNSETFKIDMPRLISELQATINKNYQIIKANSDGVDFDRWLKERSDYIETTYGHKL